MKIMGQPVEFGDFRRDALLISSLAMPVSEPSAMMSRRLAFWLFALAFTVRLLVLIRFSHSPDFVPNGDDMKFYNDWALRIMHGTFTDGHAFYGLPGYAWCLAAIYSVFGFNPFPVGLLQCFFDAGTATLTLHAPT